MMAAAVTPAAADPVSIGTAILTWVGATTAEAVAASTILSSVAFAVGEVALVAAATGFSHPLQSLKVPA
jgi:hypothetical protein